MSVDTLALAGVIVLGVGVPLMALAWLMWTMWREMRQWAKW